MMTQAKLTKPWKWVCFVSHLVTTLLKLWSQAKNRSTFHLRFILRNSLPSWVLGFFLFDLCGAIRFIPFFLNLSSNPSESYALSPKSLRICPRTNRLLMVFSTNLLSCGDALSICTAIGRPLPSVIAMILVPLPRLVGPTYRPLFLPLRRSRL